MKKYDRNSLFSALIKISLSALIASCISSFARRRANVRYQNELRYQNIWLDPITSIAATNKIYNLFRLRDNNASDRAWLQY